MGLDTYAQYADAASERALALYRGSAGSAAMVKPLGENAVEATPSYTPSRWPELRMFFVEYFTRGLPPTPRNEFADSISAAEAYNEQNKRECNEFHSAARCCDQRYCVAI